MHVTKPSAFVAGVALLGSLAVATPAFAAETPINPQGLGPPTLMGTVKSISGNTLSVDAEIRGPWHHRLATSTQSIEEDRDTLYSVNASGATIIKDGNSASIGAIAVGDHVMVIGTKNGTTVTATTIHDGTPLARDWHSMQGAPPFTTITGNGDPVIGGNVSSLSGSTLTVKTKAGTAYTVNASGATVVKNNATSSVSAIATGDQVMVQGQVNGTAVTATSIIDHSAVTTNANASNTAPHGFMGFLGGFFSRFFGFF